MKGFKKKELLNGNLIGKSQHDRTDNWIACTAATIYDPARMSEADSILMAQYLALSGLVGAYFALGKR